MRNSQFSAGHAAREPAANHRGPALPRRQLLGGPPGRPADGAMALLPRQQAVQWPLHVRPCPPPPRPPRHSRRSTRHAETPRLAALAARPRWPTESTDASVLSCLPPARRAARRVVLLHSTPPGCCGGGWCGISWWVPPPRRAAALETYINHLDQGGGEHPADGVAVRPSGRQLVAGEWLDASDQHRQRVQDALGELVLFAPPFHHKLLQLT